MYMMGSKWNPNAAIARSTFLPCLPETNDLEKGIRPPSCSLHVMKDSELFWRASFTPRINEYPFRRTPKIAFMFLVRGPLSMAPLWEKFFNGSAGLYSIYIHSLPFYHQEFPPLSVFYGRQLPSQVHVVITASRKLQLDEGTQQLHLAQCNFPTMLTIQSAHLLANRSLTWLDWSRGTGAHPATFGANDLTDEFFKKINEDETCFYNDQSTKLCYTFARKIAPSALDKLLNHSSEFFRVLTNP